MALCPIAIFAGCRTCPFFSICPLKSVIGDYTKNMACNCGKKPSSTKTRNK
jgi:hypothetical protein